MAAPQLVTDTQDAVHEILKWDPLLTERVVNLLRPVIKRYFRSEVRGLSHLPDGGALLVANHSGGLLTTDPPSFAVDYYDEFGYDRPLLTLSHDVYSRGPARRFFHRTGFIPASPANAVQALASDALVIVFPGGDYDAMRPTSKRNVVDFNGRTGYVRTAIDAGVPIVPIVSIGGQETQLFLSRGTWLANRLGLKQRLRSEMAPISFGFPFGLSLGGINLPMPAKLITQVLPPIDIRARFGDSPDVDAVDIHIREVMQAALNQLAAHRRLPILG